MNMHNFVQYLTKPRLLSVFIGVRAVSCLAAESRWSTDNCAAHCHAVTFNHCQSRDHAICWPHKNIV